jgi:deoxyribonuclease-1
MLFKINLTLLATLIISISFCGCIVDNLDNNELNHNETKVNGDNISIAFWNLQVFGLNKASNDTLLNYYAKKLDNYDIFIIQEIRDASGNAIRILAEKFPHHEYIISNRAGQSSSKEQYAVFYNDKAAITDFYDYQPEYQHVIQRPPLKATFISNNWTFTIYTIHTQPDNVPDELSILEEIVGNPVNDTIILGDLNTDGSYYDENNIDHFISWSWIVGNNIDTTVAKTNNTYDRIIINKATKNNFLHIGVIDDITSDQSDHYLVYAIFCNEKQ